MAWPDDIDMSLDHLVWNNVETVVYFEKSAEAPPNSGVSVTNVFVQSIRKDRLPADSILIKFDLTMNLPVYRLGDIVPKKDDIIERDDGTRWVVGLAELVAEESEYRVRLLKSRRGP